jgi:predicted Rossmann fold flavoprotein
MMDITSKKVAIVGGGASGLIAAYFASEKCHVTIFERQKKIGRKILVTGNGRCNISNRYILPEKYHGHNNEFVNVIFNRFGLAETEKFFSSIGIPFVEEDEGKLFPASLQASIVPKVFEYELVKRSVDIRLHRKIEKIEPENNKFRLITAGLEEEIFDSVILSCGSIAFPGAGASRSGYDLAKSMGHKVYEPFPAILPINIPLKPLHTLQGIKWNCSVSVIHDGVCTSSSNDELLFTSYGISGPAALKVSRDVNRHVLSGMIPEISIDFFPSSDRAELSNLLENIFADKKRKLSFALLGILKERMPEVILSHIGIDHEKRTGSLTEEEKELILSSLKDFRITPGKPRSFDEAVVAAGGVDVNEIDQDRMESKLIKNLFITGELLDIDGDSGGFNLQFAWSTGAIAGMSQ